MPIGLFEAEFPMDSGLPPTPADGRRRGSAADAGLLTHPAGVAFGDLILTGLTGTEASLNGLTVSGLLSDVNVLLGGGTVPNLSITEPLM